MMTNSTVKIHDDDHHRDIHDDLHYDDNHGDYVFGQDDNGDT